MNQFIQFHMNPISDTNFILISFKKATASNLHCSPSMSLARDSCLWLFQEWPDLLETLMTDARKLLKDCQKR